MSDWKNYKKLEITGDMLIPGFSIYLMEITYKGEKWFYVGMTGDNFYPSARAAFHRISGHLELSSHSTQNQLMDALKGKGIDERNFKDIHINMHNFPIKGYKKWTLTETMHSELIKENKNTPQYRNYKKRQLQIKNFEDYLIYKLRLKIKEKLLNKTIGKNEVIEKEFEMIYNDIMNIIKTKI